MPGRSTRRQHICRLAGAVPGRGVDPGLGRQAASGAVSLSFRASTLAFSGNNRQLAAGDDEGRIQAWDLGDGQCVARVEQQSNKIHCLAFAQSPVPDRAGEAGVAAGIGRRRGERLRLGPAGQAAPFVLRGPGQRCVRAGILARRDDPGFGRTFRGHVSGAAPPDALLLETPVGAHLRPGILGGWAQAGRGRPGGPFYGPGYNRVEVLTLDPGRAVASLHGLTSPVERVVYAPDGRSVTASSHDWRIGIWEAATSRLCEVLQGPRGFTPENAGLAFSGDGTLVATSAGREAKLWDVASGRELGSWTLPLVSATELRFAHLETLVPAPR